VKAVEEALIQLNIFTSDEKLAIWEAAEEVLRLNIASQTSYTTEWPSEISVGDGTHVRPPP
jgi:hypothetical protein